MKTITVFTPSFNRKHTIFRTYESLCRQSSNNFDWLIIDDGSSDGTREWVESLGEKISFEGIEFDWMGRITSSIGPNHFVLMSNNTISGVPLRIEYVYKQNGGLYTGYNVAYRTINTELCVCIDSDDYMPDDAIEKIIVNWEKRSHLSPNSKVNFCGLVGLDYDILDEKPIGGFFPKDVNWCFFEDLRHHGDTKQVMRTDLMKSVAPQIGFEGERDFNPYYMLMQVVNKYPIIVVNENFCWVEYQTTGDSMSAGIWKQYVRSPRSYAKYRIMQLQMNHGIDIKRKIELCIHYVSACILSNDSKWLRNSPYKLLTLCISPLGLLFSWVVMFKNRK